MKMKLKLKKKMIETNEVEVDASVSPDTVRAFAESVDSISGIVVGRSEETEAMKLCLMTGNHLMLEGKHGIAKSMIAEKLFSLFKEDSVVTFQKQFMKGTQTDEIFGPMKADRYKNDAVWEHNIDRMLPEAHFAYLDEVYRASDMVLPSMMGILNERTFFNGGVKVKCPLITAIGTTNFTTQNEELDAFHDRWLVKSKVEPLSTATDKRTMLRRYLDRTTTLKAEPILLSDLHAIQNAVLAINISQDMVSLYEELVAKYKQIMQNTMFISDRRLCQSLRLAQARALLSGDTTDLSDELYLESTRYGLTTLHAVDEESAWNSAFNTVIGGSRQARKEMNDLGQLKGYVDTLIGNYDPSKSIKLLEGLYKEAKTAHGAILNQEADEEPTTQQGKALKQKIVDDLDGLLASLTQEISAKKGSK